MESNFPVVPQHETFMDTALVDNGGTALVMETVPDVTGLDVENGTVEIQDGGSLGVVEAAGIGESGTLQLSGNGTFSAGSLANAGILNLAGTGVAPSVSGDYSQTATGAIAVSIQDGAHPVLNVDGNADLGGIFHAAAGSSPREEDVAFVYATPDGQLVSGLVEYSGPANDLALRVNPETGEAEI